MEENSEVARHTIEQLKHQLDNKKSENVNIEQIT